MTDFPHDRSGSALSQVLAARGEELTAVLPLMCRRRRWSSDWQDDVCSACGRVYNIFSDPPAADGVCDVCGGTVGQRADDTPEAVAKRLDLYDIETAPLVDRYEEQGLVEAG